MEVKKLTSEQLEELEEQIAKEKFERKRQMEIQALEMRLNALKGEEYGKFRCSNCEGLHNGDHDEGMCNYLNR